MNDLNNLILQGRLVKDSELKTMPNGLKILNFQIATNRSHKTTDGQWESIGNFFPLAVFGNYAEKMFPILKKGVGIIVEGFVKQDTYTKDEQKIYTTGIGVKALHIVSKKKETDAVVKEELNSEAVNQDNFETENETYIENIETTPEPTMEYIF